jgi:hypothetical protein
VTDGLLREIVLEVTGRSLPPQLPPAHGDARLAAASLGNLIRQVPLDYDIRHHLLNHFRSAEAQLIDEQPRDLLAVAAYLHDAPLRIPVIDRDPVVLPPLDDELAGAYRMLLQLDAEVSEPWTLIGGLMVFTLCAEYGSPFTRPTGDADVAVGVFTHRRGLSRFTSHLRDAGFDDVTPPAIDHREQHSYRWARGGVKIDVAVPPKANDQRNPPTAITGRPAVELPATQQALRRTQRVPVRVGDEDGHVRRPDLLAAIIIKAVAAKTDTRDPDRHREDLVSLADTLAHSGEHLRYAPQMRPKDRSRLACAIDLITGRQWRAARDPDAARAALRFLIQP